jgi:glycosidase
MPDLNFDNKKVRSEMIKVGQYWLKKGLDGFRLDAAKHIYEDFSNGDIYKQKATKKNVAWWQEFRAGLKKVNKNVYLVGEVWDSAGVVGQFLDKALDSGFNFDLANNIVGSVNDQADRGIGFYLSNLSSFFKTKSNGAFIDAPFLRNHDQTRVMSELGGDKNKAKMAASMLLTVPGNPFIYYGEEIGMEGVKPIDENVRTPFIWAKGSPTGQTTAMEGYSDQASGVNVATQSSNSASLLAHYKKMIKLRNSDFTLSDGTISEYYVSDEAIATWVRSANKVNTLVLHNLSGKTKTIKINTSDNTLKFKKISFSSNKGAKYASNKVTIPAYTTVIMKK